MAEWPPSLDIALNELEAFDAMRKFVENYWNVGGQSEDEIRYLLSAMDRGTWPDHSPGDPATWSEWIDSINFVLRRGSTVSNDPLAGTGDSVPEAN